MTDPGMDLDGMDLDGMDLDGRLEEYLRIRRSLGYKLERDGKLLAQFIAWLHEQHAAAVTVEHAVAWVSLPAAGSGWLRLRMSVVRGFAAYLHTLDPAVPVPPAGLFPPGPHRAVPYLYSADELAALLAATDTLRYPLQRATYRTLIGLLAVTGLRVGEGIGLNDADLDDEHGVLTPASSAPPLPIDIGTKMRLIPGHCDPTVNLHEWYVAVRGGVVEAVWRIDARGALF